LVVLDFSQKSNMTFNQIIKKYLAKGDTSKAIQTLLQSRNQKFLVEFQDEIILISNQYKQWRKEFRLGFKPDKSELNRLNYAILDIVDQIESYHDLENIALNSHNPFKSIKYECLYDSNINIKPKVNWTLFNTYGIHKYSDSFTYENTHEENIVKLKAHGVEDMGMEKPVNRLIGFVELEYMAISTFAEKSENLSFVLIPMKHNSLGQTGYIEVGSDEQDDPKNPFSPYRKRFIVPNKHIQDKKWHKVSIEFDFRYIEEAYYALFAPRINEGVWEKGRGELWFKNLKIFG